MPRIARRAARFRGVAVRRHYKGFLPERAGGRRVSAGPKSASLHKCRFDAEGPHPKVLKLVQGPVEVPTY